jgi:hypothetical protein
MQSVRLLAFPGLYINVKDDSRRNQMGPMNTNETRIRVLDFSKRLLAHRYLPAVLAIGAILVMLPALKTGLILDDLPQRSVELKPDQLPRRMHMTGNPLDSGNFSTVLRDLFFNRSPEDMTLMKNYGILPWWASEQLRLGLWRPVTAFTHWLDYRLYPDSPMLMHAQNIAWFAAIVFLLTTVYRKLMGTGWVAGLAALMFLLDGNTYFPVAFIANRGFILALFFGLLCLYEHHQWRAGQSRSGLALSAVFLGLSLLANEGGASTFAFILAYALVLEPGPFRKRALTVLPSILVIVLWRTVYTLSGFGLFHVGAYIDPANEPLQFAREVIPRVMVLLAGQLPFLSPDLLYAVNPLLQPKVTAFYCVAAVAALAVLLPWVRRDKTAAFWFAVMMLALIPAATVMPTSKNLGFVAVGAYGLIATFVASLITRPSPLPESLIYRIPAWVACALLILVHVPGAIAGRALAVGGTALALEGIDRLTDVGNSPGVEKKHVIIVNSPCSLPCAYAPSYKAYHHQPLPRSLRMLVPGCTSFEAQRPDDKTLVIESKAPDIFSCDDVGPIHAAYAFRTLNLHVAAPRCKKGDLYHLGKVTVEVLQVGSSDLPSRVAFRFDTSLDSPAFRWLQFDWPTFGYRPFKVPAIGQCVTLSGPS